MPMSACLVIAAPQAPLTALSLIASGEMLNSSASASLISCARASATAGSSPSSSVLIRYDSPLEPPTFCADATSAPVSSTADLTSSSVPTLAGSVKLLPPLNSIPMLNGWNAGT